MTSMEDTEGWEAANGEANVSFFVALIFFFAFWRATLS
jgi:hypothetical protein